MAVISILRPDDLVALEIETRNLRLDTKDPKNPALVVEKPAAAAYLIVRFPPQSITEKAYYEAAQNIPPPGGDDPLDPAGSVPARMTGGSRLVFRLPPKLTHIPYRIDALLDWSKFDLVVSPLALGKLKPPPIVAPGPLETALEIPYRLILSPGAGAGWVHSRSPETHAGRTALWHTSLAKIQTVKSGTATKRVFQEASEQKKMPLRAIWSPDFIDHAPIPPTADVGPFLSAMSPSDRFQIVILTSGTTGYYVPAPGVPSGGSPWVPQPIKASRLFLSTLGGWLSSRGAWPSPPTFTASDGSIQPLDLVEWVHLATQGRDHYVRIVYEGFLYPFGHRAALIKVTERKVVPPDGGVVTDPTAYLKQHMYVVVREPEKTYPGVSYQFAGREMPFAQSVRILTKVTPDIDKPAFFTDGPKILESFWIRVGAKDFQFHMAATDLAGNTINFLAPMIFMDVREQEPAFVQNLYRTSGNERECTVKGQKIAYADPAQGDTQLKTDTLFFDTELLQTQPPYPVVPFIPRLDQAGVVLPALEQILGTKSPVDIQLFSGYLSSGMDPHAGVFAELASAPPALKFSANQSGGFATPNVSLTAISARKGVVAGKATDAAAGVINPSEYFPDVSAQLFGTIPINQLIPISGLGTADAGVNAPEIRTHLLPNHKHPTTQQTIIKWNPQLTDYNLGPLTAKFNQGETSKLTLTAKIERNLAGGNPTSDVHGELSHFLLSLLNVIDLGVNSITFSSKNGEKPIVQAHLPSKNPITFTGALAFVQTLADILPPGLFGDAGPSIQLQPTQLRVTYTIGLPSIGIGVFTLEHISFLAGLDLPYLDGKPAFEFGFASRKAPFLLTVECIGGGGFVHLIVDTSGVQMVEGALEFGGQLSFDIGVASGGVHIMAGIYFQLKANFTEITGFVDIGGEVSVLGIISISIDLNLSLSYQEKNGKKMVQGRATLSISIHIIFFSISVSVSVEKSFGSTSGDPKVSDMVSEQDWASYAAAFA